MKNDSIDSVVNSIRQSTESFMKTEEQLHKTMCNPDTRKLQAAIDSKGEMDKEERIKELEVQNKDLVERIKKNQKNQIWIAILSATVGSGITTLLNILLQ